MINSVMINDKVKLNNSDDDFYYYINIGTNENIDLGSNLSQNIDIFSELSNIDEDINQNTRISYYKLLNTIKRNLNKIDSYGNINNNLSKLQSYVDEDKEITIEWIVRNNFRIGFYIDVEGSISYWKIYKEGLSTKTFSDTLDGKDFEGKIIDIINEVISLT